MSGDKEKDEIIIRLMNQDDVERIMTEDKITPSSDRSVTFALSRIATFPLLPRGTFALRRLLRFSSQINKKRKAELNARPLSLISWVLHYKYIPVWAFMSREYGCQDLWLTHS